MKERTTFKTAEVRKKDNDEICVVELSQNASQNDVEAIKRILRKIKDQGKVDELVIDTNGYEPLSVFQLLRNAAIGDLTFSACKSVVVLSRGTNLAKVIGSLGVNVLRGKGTMKIVDLDSVREIHPERITDIFSSPLSDLTQEYIRLKLGITEESPYYTVMIDFLASE